MSKEVVGHSARKVRFFFIYSSNALIILGRLICIRVGALTSGRGSRYVAACWFFYNKSSFFLTNKIKRFILAGAEQLHEKIFQLSDRVRQLEDALECLQSRCSNQPHPLLSPELLRIKTSQELYGTIMSPSSNSNAAPTSGTTPTSSAAVDQSVTRDGNLRESDNNNNHNGDPSPRGGVDLMETTTTTTTTTIATEHNNGKTSPPEVAPDILQLSTTFPFPWMMDVSIRKRIRDALPPKAEAQRICEEARANALWQ